MEGKGNGGGACRRGRADKVMSVSKSFKAGHQIPVARIARFLKKGRYYPPGTGAPVYLATVLDYLATEVLELAGNVACHNRKSGIVPKHVLLAVRNDEELVKMLDGITIADGEVLPGIKPVLQPKEVAADERKTSKTQTIVTAARNLTIVEGVVKISRSGIY